jgi:hypothetical protein
VYIESVCAYRGFVTFDNLEASERVQVVLSVVEMVVVHGLEKIPIGDDAVAVHLSARDIHVEDTVGGK